jgi:hypothetical protein
LVSSPAKQKKQRKATLSPAQRVERLVDLAKALHKSHGMAQKAIEGEAGSDLFRGWCAVANISAASDASTLICAADEIKRALASLTRLEAAARMAAVEVPTKPGASPGTGILSMHDIIALAKVSGTSTGQKPIIGPGPFADFVQEFLIAVGRGTETQQDYVVETFKYARKQMRKRSGA